MSDAADRGDAGNTTLQVSKTSQLAASGDRVYLLVFEGDTSFMVPLVPGTAVVIGRGEDAGIKLRTKAASRQHARVELTGGTALATDLGSQNGTRVNDVPIDAPRVLLSGDVITIGSATLVFHGAAGSPKRMLELGHLRQRIGEEITRSLTRGGSLAVLCLLIDRASGADVVDGALDEAFEGDAAAAWTDDDQLFVLAPRGEAESAESFAKSVLRAAATGRAGYAVCPGDGCDADTLLVAAGTAARSAQQGATAAAATTFSAFELADRTVVVADQAMIRLFSLIDRIARSDLPVLVCGETGTGKELAAAALHTKSPRSGKPLVTLNCAAIQETLVESDLFGHDKGAFSGAVAAKPGLLETADGGTVFLDEIGELSAVVQAKLLRVLETKRFTRVGEVKEREIDIRLVAATNRNLEDEVAAGRFRRDLYFRLSGATLWIPPLRERKREVPILAEMFLIDACQRLDREPMRISSSAMQRLAGHDWPGNVRELKLVMEYLAAACSNDTVSVADVDERLAGHLSAGAAAHAEEQPSEFRPLQDELRELEVTRIRDALAAAGGNKTRAAELIRMPLRTFIAKVKRYELADPD